MKISKDDVLALIEGIERATMDAPIPDALKELRERAQAPDGPYKVQKARDHRARRIWTLVDPTGLASDLDDVTIYAGRWYYEREEAEKACGRVNATIADRTSEVRAVVYTMICSKPGCNFGTIDNALAANHEATTDFDHVVVTNAAWKKAQR